MEITTFYKCACANCGEVIDYRASQAGQVVECPKCREKSQLPEPEKLGMVQMFGPPTPQFRNCPDCGAQLNFSVCACGICEVQKKHRRLMQWMAIGVAVIVVVVIAGFAAHFLLKGSLKDRTDVAAVPAPAPRIIMEQPRARGPKSIKDLRPGKFVLEKRRGSDLVIAVGDIQNESENVHHQLRADLDLLDKTGAKVGTVSDFFTEIGPHQTWHFVATVVETNAMSVRFGTITESE